VMFFIESLGNPVILVHGLFPRLAID
jgi:hypothetical protein